MARTLETRAGSKSAARRRTLPQGCVIQMLAMRDGWRLRTARWPGSGIGSILFINGRGDFIEKYAETLHDWQDQGFAVATFDWRGQGGSGRLGKTPGHGHIEDFALLKDDLAEIFAWFHTMMPGPYFAVAHSMGGHLLLRHLAEQPEVVARAVLLAPMVGISARPFGPRIAGWLARAMVAIGRGQQWVFGAGPYGHGAETRRALLTSDAARFSDEKWWVAQNPALAIGGITWGWLKAALASVARLRPVGTPLLVLMAEHEALVDNAATRRMFPAAETVQGAAHEILRERHDTRIRVVKCVKAYLLS